MSLSPRPTESEGYAERLGPHDFAFLSYSDRKVSIGSRSAAREAGNSAAATAMRRTNTPTIVRIGGSKGFTGNGEVATNPYPAGTAAANPNTKPKARGQRSCFSSNRNIDLLAAPRAIRIPISRRRSVAA